MAQSRSAQPAPRHRTPSAGTERRTSAEAPYFRFYQPVALRKTTLAVLDRLEGATDPTEHRKALADVVVDLTRCGLDEFFMKPLKLAKVGFVTEQSATLGMAGANQVLATVIRNLVGSMGAPQLRSVSRSIRQFME